MYNPPESELKKFEIFLGRSLKEDRGSIKDYSHVTENDLREFKILSNKGSVLAIIYILFKLNGFGGLSNAASYHDNVVKNGVKNDDWLQKYYKYHDANK